MYGTCISNNRHFGHDAKGLLGISGMCIGAGEIVGRQSFYSFLKWCESFVCLFLLIFGGRVHQQYLALSLSNQTSKEELTCILGQFAAC